MKNYILSIDQGTTGSTALLIDSKSMGIVSKKNYEFKQYYPKPGYVEHDLNEIFESVKNSILDVIEIAEISPDQISSIGITNQRETVCAFSRNGEPLSKAIVWQDRRTSDFCKQNKKAYSELKEKTGLPLDPYFSASKMRWLLEHDEVVQSAYKREDLLFGTIDTYLLYKLTGGMEHKTEASNASRTLLMNLQTCNWDSQLLNFFKIDKSLLPEICDSFGEFGVTKDLSFLPSGISIESILGDQQAALFGQLGQKEGSLKCTYGTGAFILMNTGPNITHSNNGLLTTVAFKHNGKPCYALEGSSYIAGAAVQFLRDNLNIIQNAEDVERLALKVSDLNETKETLLFPFFTGIGSPHWNADATASLIGLNRGSKDCHICRATLEGIALSINDSIGALLDEHGKEVTEIKVDGGACSNNLLMQIQADISAKKIVRPEVIETTAFGVALGTLLNGQVKNMEELQNFWNKDSEFTPKTSSYIEYKKKLWNSYIEKYYS